MNKTDTAGAALGGTARDSIDAAEATGGIRSESARGTTFGVYVTERTLNVGTSHGAPPAANPSLTLAGIVIGDLLATRRCDSPEAVVLEIIAACLPAPLPELAGRRR